MQLFFVQHHLQSSSPNMVMFRTTADVEGDGGDDDTNEVDISSRGDYCRDFVTI
jgi:hypothetical protein